MAFGPRSLPPDADPKKFFACSFCGECFKTKGDLNNHIRDVHKVRMKDCPS